MKNISAYAALLLLLSACTKNNEFNPATFNGTFVGVWESSTGTSGPASIFIDVHQDQTFDLVLDFDGNYLGLGDPPPNPMSGTWDPSGGKVIDTNPLYGQCNVKIEPDGSMSGVFTNVGMGIITELTYQGKIEENRITASYQVLRPNGDNSTGTLTLQKQ